MAQLLPLMTDVLPRQRQLDRRSADKNNRVISAGSPLSSPHSVANHGTTLECYFEALECKRMLSQVQGAGASNLAL
jgi:hypothetical protein